MIKKFEKKKEVKTKVLLKGVECNFAIKSFSMFFDNEEKKIVFSVFRVEHGKNEKRLIPLCHTACLEDALHFMRSKMVIYKLNGFESLDGMIEAIKQSNELIIEQVKEIKKDLKNGKFKKMQTTLIGLELFNKYRIEEENKTKKLFADEKND